MAPKRLVPSASILERWVQEGLSHQQMADRLRERDNVVVGKSAIAAALSRAGLTNRIRYEEFVPWSPVLNKHSRDYPLHMLRGLARLTYGQDISPDYELRVRNWVKRNEENNRVVSYNLTRGFHYVQRISTDPTIPPIRPPKKG